MRAHNFQDIAGQRFGALVAVRFVACFSGSSKWLCQCDCGSETTIFGSLLRQGKQRSCGCQTANYISQKLTRHGYARGGMVTREHAIWRGMLTRCTNPKSTNYADYGGRGISVCERWQRFENFIADMGPCPVGWSIDRTNNAGNYEPLNCVWASAKTQANNRRKRRWYKRPEVA